MTVESAMEEKRQDGTRWDKLRWIVHPIKLTPRLCCRPERQIWVDAGSAPGIETPRLMAVP